MSKALESNQVTVTKSIWKSLTTSFCVFYLFYYCDSAGVSGEGFVLPPFCFFPL